MLCLNPSKKKICFRFDVDTPKCAKIGMPNILKLAKRKKVSFTFFVNCGRSIYLSEAIKSFFKQNPDLQYPQLAAFRKLGPHEYLRTAILNPRIFNKYKKTIKEAYLSGHEIGLHGGRNHEFWAKRIYTLSDQDVTNEILWGVDKLNSLGIEPKGFASPCGVGGVRIERLLENLGSFNYIADRFEPNQKNPIISKNLFVNLPTTICGEGGVAYIEQQVALKRSADEIVDHFLKLINKMSLAVFYDHPFFAGDEGLSILESLIDCALDQGFEFLTAGEMVANLLGEI